LIFAGQYLWLYLFPSLPDFLTADSGQRYSASLYVLIGLILLVSLLICERPCCKIIGCSENYRIDVTESKLFIKLIMLTGTKTLGISSKLL
jgi:hypothetical protein